MIEKLLKLVCLIAISTALVNCSVATYAVTTTAAVATKVTAKVATTILDLLN